MTNPSPKMGNDMLTVSKLSHPILLGIYPRAKAFAVNPPRIFIVRWSGKTAGMLAAFQGFTAPYGGKKTGAGLQMLTHLGILLILPDFPV